LDLATVRYTAWRQAGKERFFKTATQAPRFQSRAGRGTNPVPELKLLADVGLVGFPNAGKSTLISRISAAKPKIADYPFTTLTPVLGVVKPENRKSFVVADIPGLIENAHKGAGLGFDFLRHIERTSILLHMVDVSGLAPGDPVENFKKINNELELYSRELLKKYMAVAATKIDAAEPDKLEQLTLFCREAGFELFPISAVTGAAGPYLAQGGAQEETLSVEGKLITAARICDLTSNIRSFCVGANYRYCI
jgi:GTP-binding protein